VLAVGGLTPGALERIGRELRASLALARTDSPARAGRSWPT
jgi:hypothetical protein